MFLAVNLLASVSSFGQLNISSLKPKDSCCTAFYKDGQIKRFFLKEQFAIRGYSQGIWINFDSVCNRLKQSQNIVSQTLEDNNSNVKVLHYKDSVAILYEDNFRLPIYRDLKQLEIILHNCNNTGLLLEYDEKALTKRFLIFKLVNGRYQNEKYYSNLYFNSISLENNFQFRLPNDDYITVDFYKNYYIKSIRYSSQKNNTMFSISFHLGNKPNEYGYYNSEKGRFGKWYTYYENGKLQSEGEYSGSKFKYDEKYKEHKEYDINKDGEWIYYTQKGCIEKEEFWKSGKLVQSRILNKN